MAIKVEDEHHDEGHLQAPVAVATVLPFAGDHDHDDDGHDELEFGAEMPDERIIELHLKNDPDEARYNHYADNVYWLDMAESLEVRTHHPHGALKPDGFFLPIFTPEPSWNPETGELRFTMITSKEFGDHDPDAEVGEHDHDHGEEDHGDEDHGEEDHGDEDHGEEDHGEEDHGDGEKTTVKKTTVKKTTVKKTTVKKTTVMKTTVMKRSPPANAIRFPSAKRKLVKRPAVAQTAGRTCLWNVCQHRTQQVRHHCYWRCQ